MTDFVQVMTTLENEKEAKQLARRLVEKRLAGCVQIIGPLTSVYQWQGKIDTADEYLLLIKSKQDLFPDLEAEIRANHPYDVPEILAVPIINGAAPYLNWLAGELR